MSHNDPIEQEIIDTSERHDILVWWLSQEACEQIGDDGMPETVPEYIRKEFRSRWGRNGRGRLWGADEIGDVGIPWDATKPAAGLASDCGGIVIWRKDQAHVVDLPGFLTDLHLDFVMGQAPDHE